MPDCAVILLDFTRQEKLNISTQQLLGTTLPFSTFLESSNCEAAEELVNEVQKQSKSCLFSLFPPADIISTVEFNHTGELLATGDKGGRVVIFQREPESKNEPYNQGEYNVYSTFQSHEPEFDYLKSLEIEEKINKIKWLPQQNAAHSLLSTNDKTIKLWKITERDKRPEGYNLKDEEGKLKDLSTVTSLQVPVLKPMDLMVEVTPRRIFANGHTYHVNSISVNSDCETYMSADDLRINLWHLAITDRSFSILYCGALLGVDRTSGA
ncbi:PREDICTED: serine/threonine-protein phosphatase 2A 55 kDa regulatory subunit B gamma isoform-like [Mesitornis unicolor]|uniref:serine/threonine-protein phosphatase 2A 55 kDa regulatory subunit B gamma isoform-like n=1 Tax=Mesitornis unicolor TaxID=54374 RepID=UPI00052949AB|nr:PREDICTED: serine/threonine-protein phosphatase 2A 55 kDa regulatory subunit B gamma isoform-like [Mesitornis unicolor]